MNLTKQIKEEIIAEVIADVPRTVSDPEFFQKRVTAIIEANIEEQAPPEVVAMWKDKKLRKHLNLVAGSVAYMVDRPNGVNVCDLTCLPTYRTCNTSRPLCCSEMLPKYNRQLQALFNEAQAENDAIKEAAKRLTAALAGIRTSANLIASFPELEKYLPKEVAKPTLPALTNVVADLTRLGWPKQAAAA